MCALSSHDASALLRREYARREALQVCHSSPISQACSSRQPRGFPRAFGQFDVVESSGSSMDCLLTTVWSFLWTVSAVCSTPTICLHASRTPRMRYVNVYSLIMFPFVLYICASDHVLGFRRTSIALSSSSQLSSTAYWAMLSSIPCLWKRWEYSFVTSLSMHQAITVVGYIACTSTVIMFGAPLTTVVLIFGQSSKSHTHSW